MAILGPNLVQNWAFGLYLDFDSHDLVEIAHSDCFQWYLVTNDDIKEWFLNFGPNLGHFGPKFDPKIRYLTKIPTYSYDSSEVPYSDWLQRYLITIDGIKEWPKSFGPKLWLFMLKFGVKFVFWTHRLFLYLTSVKSFQMFYHPTPVSPSFKFLLFNVQ